MFDWAGNLGFGLNFIQGGDPFGREILEHSFSWRSVEIAGTFAVEGIVKQNVPLFGACQIICVSGISRIPN